MSLEIEGKGKLSTHLSAQQVEQYRRRSLSPVELLDAGDHLVACEECRARIADVEKIDASLSALRADFQQHARAPQQHLTYQQLSAYVDDGLDGVDREIVDSHVAVCASCKEEMRELFAFKDALPLNSPNTREKPQSQTTIREKLRAWSPFGARRFGWQIVGAMTALVCVALIVWLALKTKQDSQVAVLQPTPSPASYASPSPLPTPTPHESSSNNSQDANQSPTPELKPTPQPHVQSVDNPPAAPLIALNDAGEQIAVDRRGNLVGLEAVSTREQQAVKKALLTQRLDAPASLAELKGKNNTLMGQSDVGESFSVVGPAGTIVSSARPTFRWRALEGAKSYTVKIYDTNFNLVDSSQSLNVTEWTPARPLPPGKIYTWQVAAMKEGSEIVSPTAPAPEARFRVLDEAQAKELTRALAAARNSHLARGVIYTRTGLLDEAEREFAALLKANPKSSVARKLLVNVRAMRRAP